MNISPPAADAVLRNPLPHQMLLFHLHQGPLAAWYVGKDIERSVNGFILFTNPQTSESGC